MNSSAEANVLAPISLSSIGPERSFIVVVKRALRYGDSAARMTRWALKLRPSILISTSHKVSLRYIFVRASRRLSAEVSVAFTVRVSGVLAEAADAAGEARCRFLGAMAVFVVLWRSVPCVYVPKWAPRSLSPRGPARWTKRRLHSNSRLDDNQRLCRRRWALSSINFLCRAQGKCCRHV